MLNEALEAGRTLNLRAVLHRERPTQKDQIGVNDLLVRPLLKSLGDLKNDLWFRVWNKDAGIMIGLGLLVGDLTSAAANNRTPLSFEPFSTLFTVGRDLIKTHLAG